MPKCNLPAFVDEVPHYEVRNGRMYVSMGDFCLAMPIHVFLAGAAAGREAIRKWQQHARDETDCVVPFKARGDH